MSDTPLPRVFRVDLTDKDRRVLTNVFDVASTFMLSLHGDMGNLADAQNVKWMLDHPGDVAEVFVKINKDRVPPPMVTMEEILKVVQTAGFTAKLDRIKHTLAEAAKRDPAAHAASPFRRDVEWLIGELEKRI